MKISPARNAAFDILLRIETERAFSSVLLPMFEERLSPPDRGLCHQIVLGVLRTKLLLDRLIEGVAGKKKIDLEVRVALWMGLYQLRYLDRIPAHSAINESVELVSRARKKSAKGFVNAILRKANGVAFKLEFDDEIDRLSVETSHPRWLIERWSSKFGEATAAAIAAANNLPPLVSFRFLRGGGDPEPTWRASSVVEGGFVAEGSNAELRDLEAYGKVYFQDEASQLVAHCVARSGGDRFLDVCAAPGGKTGLVTERISPTLAVAGDLHPSRVRLLKKNLAKQGVSGVHVVQYDAVDSLPFAEGSFDTVLVDAPCTGTGTIRHNPEIRYSLEPSDITELSAKQQRILRHASKMVRSGGSLVFSTCSVEPDEGEHVVARVLAETPELETVRPAVPERFLTDDGFARTWPHRDGVDGFFIAAFRKR